MIGCCADHITVRYEWRGMEVANLNNSGTVPVESVQATIPAKAYGIRMKLSYSEIADAGSSLVPAAYATSCPEIYHYITEDTIRTIRIHAIPAGPAAQPRDITDDFISPLYYGSDISRGFYTIPQLIYQVNHGSEMKQIDLIRIKNYEQSQDIRFSITVELNSGITMADTTTSITLL